ncbi:NitT/TauT family transport system permease protein [Hoeflea marina]|uniref:NitT/TauT family transport system permease protein n=1 Tax=Hoeflea marina TaxID=274592 RepID=A0A317PCY2_9HYPH|nr:ABC transporter permease [Hoeflea marina]PWV97495.1 NitT/TauT family transport system permease protein [Hoeflea marina]
MSAIRPNWQALAALVATLYALTALPFTATMGPALSLAVAALLAAGAILSMLRAARPIETTILAIASFGAAAMLLAGLTGAFGTANAGYFASLAAAWLLGWRLVTVLSGDGSHGDKGSSLVAIAVPALFGIWVLILWECIVRGAGVPFVLLPPPSAIGLRIAGSLPILAADFRQTVLKAVLFGYVVGSLAGFLVAILADRFRFLANGLLPIGNMVSALPMIGIAPIMVIWFGFDWQSKAAVVVVMTFFPMLVNTLAGLAASGDMERDLMRTYGAGHWQVLVKLRLQAAMPFIFNALKINSTLALIGAIVAEFFGTPIVGMGFRISTEVGRMNLDMVWAEIALAAIVGSLFYGGLALLERAVTFWHPSYRR